MKTLLSDLERERVYCKAQETLWEEESDDVNEAKMYLKDTRRLDDKTIRSFKIGYIPKRVPHDWAGRLIMPLHNAYGDLVALTTRDFRTNDPDKKPHLHEQFKKRRYLFGLDVAKKNIISQQMAVFVEGQFDAYSLHSKGIDFAMAILGSALTFEQITIARRYCSEFYLVFDNDSAGLKAIEKSMDIYKEKFLSGFGVVFIPVILPKMGDKKMDPDEFINHRGKDAFLSALKKAKEETLSKGYEWYLNQMKS